MYFKKIEMIGFKSFADRTVIEFNGGFTAIVGPNGCGKSNVSDAIRWVLGEQSAKSLRGDNMQDVIFKGTEKRKSLSYCEVTLTFDNTDRFFNIAYDELSITRKLYRSGESEYQINKNTCRLRDITDILFDSGIGKNGYSVIGQGKVSEIVDEKPEERRAMFEEAAGIAKFKSRKDEAERKLERTRDNLTRIDDIRAEIDRQMGPLRKQAEDAKKYLEYKGQLKDLEVNAYVFQYENANVVKDEIKQKLQAIEEELFARQTDLENITRNYAEEMDRLSDYDKQIASLNDELLRLTVELEKQEGETKVARERINYTQKENDRINLDITNAKVVIETCEEQEVEKGQELQALNDKLNVLNSTYEEMSNKHLQIVDEMSLSETEAGQSQQKIIETLGSLSDIRSSLSRLEAEKTLLLQNRENLEKNLKEVGLKLEAVKDLQENSMKLINSSKEEYQTIKQQHEEVSGRIFVGTRDVSELETEKANLTTQVKVYENRKKLLIEMQAEYEGYAHSVRKILKESERNSEMNKKMVGVLASLIKVPAQYETAIEVALGNAVQNIVTYDENNAKDLIAFLKENKYGRATFLPISSMRRRDMDERSIAGRKGVFGVASKLISYDKQIDNVVSNLLGGTVIVDTLATAVDLARDNKFSFKIVTLEGDVVSTQGSLTGGSKKSEITNLISRQREIETLTTEIDNLNQKEYEIKNKIDYLKVDLNASKQSEKQIAEQKNELEIRLAKEQEKLESINKDLEELEDEKKLYEMEKTSVSNKLNLIEQDLSQSSLVQNALSGNKEDADILVKQKQERYNQIRKERDEIVSNMTTVKVEIASCEAKIKALNDELDRILVEKDRQTANIETLSAHLSENEKFIANAEEMIRVQIENAKPSMAKDNLQKIRRDRENLENSKIAISAHIKKLDDDKTVTMGEIAKVNDKKYREEANLTKVDTELEAMQERIYEEYSLTYNGCLEFRRPDFEIKEALISINKLKKDISALGYVNVHAIEDCSTLLERYNDMTTQADDLRKAEDDLVKIIKDLSSEMLTKFNDEFEKINESFKIVFKELFGGGNARLELTEAEDPLNAGVEIMVQLPGKAANKLSLLSGGEKTLTAIALLFSILRLKPLPFSLLDEIEAALDDANIERFATYLKKLSQSTQFIVITHRKPTMELSDSLFGVTMEEKGVSKTVSVKLADAIRQVEEAN
ncbi:MAG: chromosome segregation protein SMC [Clostridiales bacterium]|nr:chromosome segregation protein SMC [Clostridiales bacterium]